MRPTRPPRPALPVALPAILLSLLAVACAACGAATPTSTAMTLVPVSTGDHTITVGIDQAPQGCNPNTPEGDNWATQLVLEPVLPSAFVVNDQGDPIGNQQLVQSAELTNTTPQTVVYTLNPKAVWSDGVAVTAADFVYAWEQQRGPVAEPPPTTTTTGPVEGPAGTTTTTTTAPPAGTVPVPASIAGYRDIKSVTGSNGGHTVTVVFANPFADWSMLFANLLPAHVLTHTGWNPTCTSVDPAIDLSAGPYMIHSVTSHEVQLVANPQWWGTRPEVRHLDVRFADSPSQLASWLARGTADVVQPSSFDANQLAEISGHPSISSTVGLSSTFLQLEFSTTGPSTADVAVRQAVAYAVDRQALVNSVVGWADSGIVPATSHIWAQGQNQFVHPSPPSNLPNSLDAGNVPTSTTTTGPPSPSEPFPTTASPADSARLLSNAGYSLTAADVWVTTAGTPLTLRLAVDTQDGFAAAAAPLLVQQLKQADLTVTTVPEPSADATGAALSTGQADLALLPRDASPYGSQAIAWYTTSLGTPGKNGSQDWSNFDSPDLEASLNKAVHALNPVTGNVYYQQADQLLWSDMVALPLFDEPSLFAASDTVAGAGPNANGPGLLWYPETWQVQVLEPVNSTTPHS